MRADRVVRARVTVGVGRKSFGFPMNVGRLTIAQGRSAIGPDGRPVLDLRMTFRPLRRVQVLLVALRALAAVRLVRVEVAG